MRGITQKLVGGTTHHAWIPINNVERRLVARVGMTRISERVPLRIALLPA
jgi:hypothetical protein